MIPVFSRVDGAGKTLSHPKGYLDKFLQAKTITANRYNVTRLLFEIALGAKPEVHKQIMAYLRNKKAMEKTILVVDRSYFMLSGIVEEDSFFIYPVYDNSLRRPTTTETIEFWAAEGTTIALSISCSRAWRRHCVNSGMAKCHREGGEYPWHLLE